MSAGKKIDYHADRAANIAEYQYNISDTYNYLGIAASVSAVHFNDLHYDIQC